MSSALGKLLVKSTTRIIKNTSKFELAIDDLIEKFKESCPPKDELLKIVQQKNQIQSALSNVLGEFSRVNSTVNATKTIVTTVGTAVKVIKSIPLPTSVPPGIGIPVNVITLLADSLDTLGDLVKGAKASLKIVPPVAKTVTESSQIVLDKLTILDGVLNECIEELLGDLEWRPDVEYNIGDHVTFNGNYYASQIDLNLNIPPIPETVPVSWTLSDEASALNWLMNTIGNVAATSGISTDVNINVASEEELTRRLQPGANPRFLYQKTGFPNPDWLLTLEYNPNNEFAFPQRRIRAENINQFDGNPYKGIVVYNIYGKKYSYSTSVEVLVEEAKFVIEQLDTTWYINNNTNFNTSGEFNRGNQTTTDTTAAVSVQGSSGPQGTTNQTPGLAISFDMGNLENDGTESRHIDLPTNFSNPSLNQILGRVITTAVSQSVGIYIKTGINPFNNTTGFGSSQTQDPIVGVTFVPDILLNLNTNQNPDFSTKTYTSENATRVFRYTYNEIGEYSFKLNVIQQDNILPQYQAETYVRLEQTDDD